jgi:hypothetical protein
MSAAVSQKNREIFTFNWTNGKIVEITGELISVSKAAYVIVSNEVTDWIMSPSAFVSRRPA